MSPLETSLDGLGAPQEAAEAAKVPREALELLLLQHRSDPCRVDVSLYAQLDLLAYGCVLARRGGSTPTSAAIHGYMEALANNIPLRRALLQAAAALATAGVRAMVYKGQDYLERIYGELGARPMADVDLLVPEHELGRAERALLDAGWKADPNCKLIHERKFCKDGLAIDLHHALLQPARMQIDHAEIFSRAQACSFAPGLFVLERTDAFLVHCINQTVKGYHLPPSSYLELQVLLEQADPKAALARARSWRAQSALYTSLRVLGELGHPGAKALVQCVPLKAQRKLLLDGIVTRFALRSILRERPSRATLLALKTTLIDDPAAAARFVPQWFVWQMPFKRARPLAHDDPPSRAPPKPWQTTRTSTAHAESSCGRWSTQRPSC